MCMGRASLSRGATQIMLAAISNSLYRAIPSDSSFAAPEWNKYVLLLPYTTRQLSAKLDISLLFHRVYIFI